MSEKRPQKRHIELTSHPGMHGPPPVPIRWGAPTARERGPIIGALTAPERRNVIGTHSGSYAVYRALAVAAGVLDPAYRPDLTDTAPTDPIGPNPSWLDPARIVSLDPFGAVVSEVFASYFAQGQDIRPSPSPMRISTPARDLGALVPRHEDVAGRPHAPGSEIIVAWRALTVALLDRVAERVRQGLGLTRGQLPLARVLEGGTWSAGRAIARARRVDGGPPIRIQSDGTVF
jgi:hypothetical protein